MKQQNRNFFFHFVASTVCNIDDCSTQSQQQAHFDSQTANDMECEREGQQKPSSTHVTCVPFHGPGVFRFHHFLRRHIFYLFICVPFDGCIIRALDRLSPLVCLCSVCAQCFQVITLHVSCHSQSDFRRCIIYCEKQFFSQWL